MSGNGPPERRGLRDEWLGLGGGWRVTETRDPGKERESGFWGTKMRNPKPETNPKCQAEKLRRNRPSRNYVFAKNIRLKQIRAAIGGCREKLTDTDIQIFRFLAVNGPHSSSDDAFIKAVGIGRA